MFTTKLRIEDAEDGKNWVLIDDLIFVVSPMVDHIVPAGFHTDLASVPRVIRSIVPKTGKYNRAAVLHDYFYRNGEPGITKKYADKLFLKAMLDCGVKRYKAKSIYNGVKWCGGPSWKKGHAS